MRNSTILFRSLLFGILLLLFSRSLAEERPRLREAGITAGILSVGKMECHHVERQQLSLFK
ncbi:hypothetical protein IIC38_02530 [candidate division KSB1 bacterium]|nr:hypothetical protein [candidate division KSB1 bacterium]